MSVDTTDDKLKKYKLTNNHANDAESIELKPRRSTHVQPNYSRATTIRYRLENFFDFNLKFNSIFLERLYKKSYLSVTRFLFRKYLFFIIALTAVWIAYFYFDNDRAQLKLTGERYRYNITNETFVQSDSVSFYNDDDESKSYTPLMVYLIVISTILTGILILLSIGELKESNYRNLERKLKLMEFKKQVDCKMAEEDLQKALKEVAKKEKEYQELSKRLNASYLEVSKSREMYSKLSNPIALVVIMFMFGLCFLGFIYPPSSLTPISHFVWYCEAVLMLYLIFPFQMSVPIVFGATFSVLFEIMSIKKQVNTLEKLTLVEDSDYDGWSSSHYDLSEIVIFCVIKSMLHVTLHVIGAYLKLSIQAIKRDTFIKVANMHKDYMHSADDKEITERMIKSIMPPLFTSIFGKPEDFKKSVNCMNQMRPLFIYPVKELSILFADIVGFTRMSSSKTAEELVFLLNDLYGRFDKLCETTNCEKISTLGDCYYCVSGCLNGELDHAKCCVEMGLKMVKEIETFNQIHKVDVNMRVGVHTGNALCGFIGGKRFRFDVWSSDVTLANKMESSGRPGSVHISQDTYECLKDHAYTMEEADAYLGKKTYFVMKDVGKKTVADVLKKNAAPAVAPAPILVDQVDPESLNFTEQEAKRISQNDVQLLSMTLKNGDFFQTDYNAFTMRFYADDEKKYQNYLMDLRHKSVQPIKDKINDKNFGKLLWTHPQNLLFIGMVVSFIVNFSVSTGYLLTFLAASISSCMYHQSASYTSNLTLIIVLIVILLTFQLALTIGYLLQCTNLVNKKTNKKTFLFDKFLPDQSSYTQSERKTKSRYVFIRYTCLHLIGMVLMCLMPIIIISTSLPIMSNIFNYSLAPLTEPEYHINNVTLCEDYAGKYTPRLLNIFGLYTWFLFIVSLIHFSVQIQLSGLFKTLLAFLFSCIFGFVSLFGIYGHFNFEDISGTPLLGHLQDVFIDGSFGNSTEYLQQVEIVSFSLYSNLFFKGFVSENAALIIDVVFLVMFIWVVNRQSEFIYRLSFKCDQNAHLNVRETQEQKDLANWLIEVVLPSHVMNHVKLKQQYSKNYDCVGVLFLSLCNFGEFFEETFEGGRNLLRVLNEISVDFDRLFDEPKYANVEKIKSIGSTFMIASGLQNSNNAKNNKHLYDLIDFALELNEKLEAFNNEAMSVCHFKFQIRMGFHCGPVTAGVIGTERLLYDIWGDTVNVASRMDSTGMSGIMQTTEEVTQILGDKYKFNYRGSVNIKGKDNMVTYMLNPKENVKASSE